MNHVALVIPTLDRLAGAERQVLLLAKGLLRRNWRVTVVALSGTGDESARELVTEGASFLSLEMRKGLADPRGWIRFHGWLRRESPDIVHAHLPHAAWMARWSRLFAPTRVLIDSIHTSAMGTLGRRLGYRCSNWFPDRVSAVSEGAAEAHRSGRMVSDHRLIVLPNGVDVHHWRPNPSVRRELRLRLRVSSEFLWFTAGRLDPVKDYPALLSAVIEVPSTAHLVVAGTGPLESQLRRITIQHGLERRVRFLGFQQDLLPWMQAADAFVHSSRWEGLPMSLLEAGACALPAVVTDVPGSREIIAPGRTGFLAPAGDPAGLRAAMIRLMQLSAEERANMGNRARERILTHFSLDTVLNRWEALYHCLLENCPRTRRWARTTRPGKIAAEEAGT
jgi:glycosyltransferase involved in cell wall biosynthesis